MKAATHALAFFAMSTMLSACGQSQMAQVMNKGNQFFGRDTTETNLAMRMPQDPAIAAKYHTEGQYAASASLDSVSSSDLPPPATTPAQPVMKVAFREPEAPALTPKTAMATQFTQTMQLVNADVTAPAFIWPVDGRVISSYGRKSNGLVNDGINIEAAEGRPIWAAAAGEVVYAGNGLEGYGNLMIVRHDGGWMTAYGHASDMLVNKGMRVSQGDLLGYVGKTGDVQTAQLHFGIRKGKNPVNPETLLPQHMAAAQ